jgi:hypothetical protein
LLTKGTTSHVPIAISLDGAQASYGQTMAGLASLGIKDITNENLSMVHRSTRAITRLALFVIQRSTDLFGPEFPDFSQVTEDSEIDKHPQAQVPRVEYEGQESPGFPKFVLRRIRELRKENVRQVAIVCHAEQYWGSMETELSSAELSFQVLRERGERIRADQPLVVLCRPAQIGGQEFDAVMIVGLEMGVVPPKLRDNEALNMAVEQQSIRETYLSVSRARYRVLFLVSRGAEANQLLQEAVSAGLVASDRR